MIFRGGGGLGILVRAEKFFSDKIGARLFFSQALRAGLFFSITKSYIYDIQAFATYIYA